MPEGTKIEGRVDSVDRISSGHELYEDDVALTVEFEGLNEPQAIAIMAMFDRMQSHGRVGSSRWLQFYADGDGPLHPSINYGLSDDLIQPGDDEYDELKDVVEIGDNRFDFDPAVGWFIDHALDINK